MIISTRLSVDYEADLRQYLGDEHPLEASRITVSPSVKDSKFLAVTVKDCNQVTEEAIKNTVVNTTSFLLDTYTSPHARFMNTESLYSTPHESRPPIPEKSPDIKRKQPPQSALSVPSKNPAPRTPPRSPQATHKPLLEVPVTQGIYEAPQPAATATDLPPPPPPRPPKSPVTEVRTLQPSEEPLYGTPRNTTVDQPGKEPEDAPPVPEKTQKGDGVSSSTEEESQEPGKLNRTGAKKFTHHRDKSVSSPSLLQGEISAKRGINEKETGQNTSP